MDYKLELVIVPVSDVDRAKRFYTEQLGFPVDVDHSPNDELRVVQLTPPGSACSINIGKGVNDAEPGSLRGTHLVVDDIEAARAELVERGAPIGPIQHYEDGKWLDGKGGPWNSFAHFEDPDGNSWQLQERPAG
jgi:catechol 2,3-dioxygenase-like lactoylglutathione lyase family enzyme